MQVGVKIDPGLGMGLGGLGLGFSFVARIWSLESVLEMEDGDGEVEAAYSSSFLVCVWKGELL